MRGDRYKYYLKLLPVLLVISFLYACTKETVDEWLDYKDFSSIVGQQAQTVRFFNNNSGIPDEQFPTIDFEANTFTEDTKINIEYVRLYGLGLPLQLSPVAEKNYIWFFSSENKPLQKKVTVHLPLPADLSQYLLNGYKNLLRVYRINRNQSYGKLTNWIHVQDAVFDPAKNEFTVNTGDFDCGYCILFPEIQKDDQVIIEGRGDVLGYYFDKSVCIQHLVNMAYFTPESEDDKGFYYDGGLSRYSASGYWNQLFNISFAFRGQEPGTYSGNDIALLYQTVLLQDGTYLYSFAQTENAVIEVEEYGDIGEYVTGTIRGTLQHTIYIDQIDFYCYFRLKRTR